MSTCARGRSAEGACRRPLPTLFKTSAETLITIAADPKHLSARVGIITVLHTWGSALTHHSHVHMIVPGGGLGAPSIAGGAWACLARQALVFIDGKGLAFGSNQKAFTDVACYTAIG